MKREQGRIHVGSCVQLASGGPAMTVVRIAGMPDEHYAAVGMDTVTALRFDGDGQEHYAHVPAVALVLAPRDDSPPIESLGLPGRALYPLRAAGIETVDQLRSLSENDIANTKGIGRVGFDEIIHALEAAEAD